MTTTAVKCIRCDAEMESGLLLDVDHNGFRQTEWVAGAPEKSACFGLKVQDKRRFKVVTRRCPKCGYLESYTDEPVD